VYKVFAVLIVLRISAMLCSCSLSSSHCIRRKRGLLFHPCSK